LTSGNNVTISDARFDITDYFNILAAKHLTLSNFVATAYSAHLKASSYTLSNWSVYANEVWIDGIDIYNDPRFNNSLVYDRIVRVNKQEAEECKEEGEECVSVISGNWLTPDAD